MTARRALELAGLGGRLAAGGVFVYAGFLKAAAPAQEFAFAIESYKVTGPRLSLLAAYSLPWAEIVLGLALLCGVRARAAAAGIAGLLVLFEGLLLSALVRGIPVQNCGCFGSSGGRGPGAEFLFNIPLLAAALLAWKYGRSGGLLPDGPGAGIGPLAHDKSQRIR